MTAAAKTEPKTRETEYVVLKHHTSWVKTVENPAPGAPGETNFEFYEIVANVTATSWKRAVEQYCTANKAAPDIAGDYIAVLARHWPSEPIPVGARNELVLTFGTNGAAEEGEQS